VHYGTTAEEIWESCEGKIDMVVCSAGTGGTLTGVARRLKELNPAVIVVAVDPCGSILAEPDAINDHNRNQSYAVEGIGYDFIPTVLDRAIVDVWVKTDDNESLIMARRLIREEGLFAGGSSGAAMCGALAAARSLRADQRCVVILPDSIRNYMSKHVRDSWMSQRGFVDEERDIGTSSLGGPLSTQWWSKKTVADLRFAVFVFSLCDFLSHDGDADPLSRSPLSRFLCRGQPCYGRPERNRAAGHFTLRLAGLRPAPHRRGR
jgi:cystathionine beta-synthase